ncbi:MAG TPA: sulfite exporter TauE/SafE family protein [Gaiellaceae bacterium]|nr:sulfite exporter TauE/SafE family protein [Gaiellaceae bacterium]
MKRLALLVVALASLLGPASAAAHPLGNFTVNRFAAVDVSGDRLFVRYAADLAEIPTYQVGGTVSAAKLGQQLVLRVDGRRSTLRLLDSRISNRPGAGGLPTLRLDAVFEGRRGTRVELVDRTFAGRIGWREVVVRASRGAAVTRASVPAESVSDELRHYPSSRLRSPLAVTRAEAVVAPGTERGAPPSLGSALPMHAAGGFEGLVSHDLTVGFVLLSLVLALFWGAAHALEPGHGKAIVAGYLVGSRGRPRDAVALGAIVTVSHTLGVFAFGLVTLGLSQYIVPERLYPWLSLAAGLLVVSVGVGVLRSRLHELVHRYLPDHDHEHDQGHTHERGLLGVGISGGIIPCPTALVVLLAAISLHRVGYGLVLIVAFSVGLAVAITSIGLFAVTARRAFARAGFDGPIVRALPTVSALVVLALGVVMTVRALPQLA